MRKIHFLILVCFLLGVNLVIPIIRREEDYEPSDIPVLGDPPDEDDWWIYTEPGPYEIYTAPQFNWTKVWQVLRNKVHWSLEVYNPNTGEWVEDNQYLTIHIDNISDNSRKVNLTFDAPYTTNYRLTFGIDYDLKDYANLTGEHEVTLTYENCNRTFNLIFNWSKMTEIAGLEFSHGTKEINGKDYFWWRVRKDNVQAGTHVDLDPSYVVDSAAVAVMYGHRITRTSSGRLWTCYHDSSLDIYTAYSDDDGITWTSNIVPDTDSYDSYHPAIAVDSNDVVHLVWYGKHAGSASFQLRHADSADNFIDASNITSASAAHLFPDVEVDSNNKLHVVCEKTGSGDSNDNQVFYFNSTDGGDTWSTEYMITNEDDNADDDWKPYIIVDDDDQPWVFFSVEDGASNLYDCINYTMSTDSGNTWSDWRNTISTAIGSDERYPSACVDKNGDIHVSWAYNTYVKFRTYTNGAWDTLVNIDELNTNFNSGISYENGNNTLHIVYWDSTGTAYIEGVYNESTSWSGPTTLESSGDAFRYISMIGSNWPEIDGVNPTVPETGFSFVFYNTTTTKFLYYCSSDISWQEAEEEVPEWTQIESWNGSVFNDTLWVQDEELNGSIFNSSNWIQDEQLNGSIFNNTVFIELEGINGSIFNATVNTSVDWITPWMITNDTWDINVTSYGLLTPSNVTLWYRFSDDNTSWDSGGGDGASGSLNLSDNTSEILDDIGLSYTSLGRRYHEKYLIKFNLSSIPNRETISDAQLYIYVYQVGATWDGDLLVGRVDNQTWTDGDNEQLLEDMSNDTWSLLSGWGSSTGQWIINVTDIIDAESGNNVTIKLCDPDNNESSFNDGLTDQYTFIGENSDAVDHYIMINITNSHIAAYQPFLVVNYTNSSATPIPWQPWQNVANPDYAEDWQFAFDFPNGTGYYQFYSIGTAPSYNETAPSVNDTYCYYEESIAEWHQDEEWNGSLFNTSFWIQTDESNGSLYNISAWLSLSEFNGSLFNETSVCAVETLAGSIYNDTIWNQIHYSENWYNKDFGYRKLITINSSQVDETLVGFPVLISTEADAELIAHAQADGDDIMFISFDDNTTKYSHEIDEYSSGELYAWVNISVLSSTSDTKLWMYYGNPTCESQSDGSRVWDGNFSAVYHMLGNATTVNDSTIRFNNGTKLGLGRPYENASGYVGSAQTFCNTTSDYINCGNDENLAITTNITVSAWIYCHDMGGISGRILGRFRTSMWSFRTYSTSSFELPAVYGGVAQTPGFSLDSQPFYCWNYVTATYNGTTINYYRNGSLIASKYPDPNGDIAVSTNNMYIGIESTYAFNGTIDEIRLSNTTRNQSWIQTEYNTMQNKSTFISLGGEEGYNINGQWNGSIYNYTVMNWSQSDEWNGSFYNQSQFLEIESINGSFFNDTSFSSIESVNGSIFNHTSIALVESINGSFYNSTAFSLVESLNGSIFNATVFCEIEHINGSIFNSTLWNLIEVYNGSIFNTSGFTSYSEINGSIYNITVQTCMSCTQNGINVNCSFCGSDSADYYRWIVIRPGHTTGDTDWCEDCDEMEWTFEDGGEVEIRMMINVSGDIKQAFEYFDIEIDGDDIIDEDDPTEYENYDDCVSHGFYWWDGCCHNQSKPLPWNDPDELPDADDGKKEIRITESVMIFGLALIFLTLVMCYYFVFKRRKRKK